MLAAVTPCAPLWLDDDFLLANHRGANVVMAASRHTKIQLRFLGVPNAGFFKFYLRSSASSFGRISDIMAWKETSGFQLAWCVIWNLYDRNLFVSFSLIGAWFETCTMRICQWKSAWCWSDPKSSFPPLFYYWYAEVNVEHKPFIFLGIFNFLKSALLHVILLSCRRTRPVFPKRVTFLNDALRILWSGTIDTDY